jgi:DNA-binding NarL/FixJ family response regulator
VRSACAWDDPHVSRTVLIVDDFAGFRRSARALLQDEGFEVVGEACDGPTALAEVERLSPAVVLLDVQLPGEDGFAVADRLARASNPPAVVLVSTRSASAYGPYLTTTSARGFIAKADLSGERLAALLE